MFALRSPVTRVMALAVIGLFLAASQADARAGRGGGFGSRGSRTWSQPAPTPTAPQAAQPIQRSTTPQQAPGVNQAAPRAGAAQPARSGFFGNRGGLLGGLVGAGLIGMLLGYGLFGGLGGLGSILGLLLQVVLVVLLVRFAIAWWQRRRAPGRLIPHASAVGALMVTMIEAPFGTPLMALARRADRRAARGRATRRRAIGLAAITGGADRKEAIAASANLLAKRRVHTVGAARSDWTRRANRGTNRPDWLGRVGA